LASGDLCRQQEEAPSFDVDTLVLRDTTERPEGVKLGYATLVGCDSVEKILTAFEKHYPIHRQITQNPYGDGLASVRIVDYLATHYLVCLKKTNDVFMEFISKATLIKK
jgi:UDP-N-acetylglucosamine 2-epimerase (non-hydrolysing)